MAPPVPPSPHNASHAPDVEEMFSFGVYQSVIGFQISKAADGLVRALNAIITAKGLTLTPREFVILNLLHEESPLPQTQLVERSYKDPAATSRLVASLHRKGMIERLQPDGDRRVKLICLTAKGRATRAAIVPELSQVLRSAIHPASDDDLRAAQRVIGNIIGATLDMPA